VLAIRIITGEHLRLAAVLRGMLHAVRHVRFGGAQPDLDLLGAMVSYIRAFPERFHHPKEDEYLFRLLRERNADAAPLLDRLQAEHRASAHKVTQIEQALMRCQRGGAPEFAKFASAVAGYAAFHWDHVRAEEYEVIPLAESFLLDRDWEIIDAAFTGHSDPLLGAEAGAEFSELFRRIIALAPPPLGTGPGRSADDSRRSSPQSQESPSMPSEKRHRPLR